jgi:hypothetical protein
MKQTQHARAPRAPLDEMVTLRLPSPMLRRIDSVALYSMSPRAIALRRLLARGLEAEESTR